MDMHPAEIEPVTVSEILELATWNRPRSQEELHSFVENHHAALPNDVDNDVDIS